MEQQSRITNSTVVALIIGLILGFAGGAYWYKSKMAKIEGAVVKETSDTTEKEAMTTKPEVTTPTSPVVSTVVDTNIVTAPNQKAGSTVLVDRVVSETEIWVAVREDNGGLMGNILGAKKVAAGTSEDVVIELLRPTVANAKYYVVLFRDNGDGMFDNKTDAIIESDGRIVVSTFKTQ